MPTIAIAIFLDELPEHWSALGSRLRQDELLARRIALDAIRREYHAVCRARIARLRRRIDPDVEPMTLAEINAEHAERRNASSDRLAMTDAWAELNWFESLAASLERQTQNDPRLPRYKRSRSVEEMPAQNRERARRYRARAKIKGVNELIGDALPPSRLAVKLSSLTDDDGAE